MHIRGLVHININCSSFERSRAFYEKRGFSAVRFGVSPPPESEADVEYHWKPA